MQITKARYEGGELVLTTGDASAKRMIYDFKPGEYELVRARKKRSLDANAYCWVLCTKLSEATGIPKDEVYRHNIRESNNFYDIPVRSDAVDDFGRIWQARGIGWFIELIDDSNIPGYKLIRAYYGSSTYDSRLMALFIDGLVQDAKNVGVEVLSERELSLLKEAWGNDGENKSAGNTNTS